jgi:hypothetical protein
MRTKTNYITLTLILVSIIGIASCTSVRMNTPQGFAHFDKEREYKAVSFDNVYIRAYMPAEEELPAETPVKTWVSDINRSLLSKGYVLISAKEIASISGDAGIFSEYSVIFNGEDWVYSFYALKKGKTFLVTEITGAKNEYNARKNEILKSIVTVEVK